MGYHAHTVLRVGSCVGIRPSALGGDSGTYAVVDGALLSRTCPGYCAKVSITLAYQGIFRGGRDLHIQVGGFLRKSGDVASGEPPNRDRSPQVTNVERVDKARLVPFSWLSYPSNGGSLT